MLRIVYAFSIISGTIIGAGLFALPYLTLKTNPWVMTAYFVVLGAVVIAVHYFYAVAARKTPDFMRLPGFVKYHLGKTGYKIALVSGILGLMGANLVYLILGGRFLFSAVSPIFGFGEMFYTLIYFATGAILIFFGIKAIDKVQLIGLLLFLFTLAAIFIKGREDIDFSGLVFESNPSYFLLPYGVVLFSLWGLSLIPEAEEVLGNKAHLLKKIIPFAIVVPILLYAFFTFLILGLSGTQTSPDALSGLSDSLDNGVIILALIFALLTTFTSFITLGLTLKKTLWFDLGLNKHLSWAITCFVPLSLYFIGLKDFVQVVSFVGGTMLVVDGILVSLIYRKISPPRVRSVVYPVIFALALAFVYQIMDFFIW